MDINEVKARGTELLGREISDEEAAQLLEELPEGEVSDEEMEAVAGGTIFRVKHYKPHIHFVKPSSAPAPAPTPTPQPEPATPPKEYYPWPDDEFDVDDPDNPLNWGLR